MSPPCSFQDSGVSQASQGLFMLSRVVESLTLEVYSV